MPPSPLPAAATRTGHRLRALHRLFVVTLLGFASGLPLALTGQALQAWLSEQLPGEQWRIGRGSAVYLPAWLFIGLCEKQLGSLGSLIVIYSE